jgi:hypothetical protein
MGIRHFRHGKPSIYTSYMVREGSEPELVRGAIKSLGEYINKAKGLVRKSVSDARGHVRETKKQLSSLPKELSAAREPLKGIIKARGGIIRGKAEHLQQARNEMKRLQGMLKKSYLAAFYDELEKLG